MSADYRSGPFDMADTPAAATDPSADDLADELGAEPAAEEPERRGAPIAKALHGGRLDKALVELVPEFSRNHLQGLVERGHVWVDGVTATSSSRKVLAGQRLEIELVPTPEVRAFRPEAIALDIVYEDDHLAVINKPAGMVVHPAAGNWSGTLLNGLLAHHPGAAALPRAGIVHRLDKDTSGLMMVAKNLAAMTQLVRLLAARDVHRAYVAVVHGLLREDSLRIEAPIGRDPRSRVRMAVVGSGKPAMTDVEVAARSGRYTAVRCRLHTGRTHQIRVHLSSRGHPLVGDAVYGGSAALGMQRQALHAQRLSFAHPASGQAMSFEADGPADFAAAWQAVVLDATTDATNV